MRTKSQDIQEMLDARRDNRLIIRLHLSGLRLTCNYSAPRASLSCSRLARNPFLRRPSAAAHNGRVCFSPVLYRSTNWFADFREYPNPLFIHKLQLRVLCFVTYGLGFYHQLCVQVSVFSLERMPLKVPG